ncbi:MAG: hypothetical protein JWQ87_2516 [Candidatus Sulfotelmatobacter sp.]|nr:hypothetical protein [Candidatus Sulfotelmatobacter sp.]
MAKGSGILLLIVLASALAGAQVLGQTPGGPEPDFKNAFVGSSVACSQPSHTIFVPRLVAERAKIKARLLNLLRDSLYDDARGVVNIARENEIKKLANKLRGRQTD